MSENDDRYVLGDGAKDIKMIFECHGKMWHFHIFNPELLKMGETNYMQYSQSFMGTISGLETENVTIWPDDNELNLGMIVKRICPGYDRGVEDGKKFLESPDYASLLPWLTQEDVD